MLNHTMFLLRNSLCNVPVEHLSNILWVRGTICAWHTLEHVVRGDKNVYMLVHATSHINEPRFSLLCCSFCWLCLKKQTWTHTLLACVFVNSTGSHVWNCHGGGRVGGCGVRVWCLRCTLTGQMHENMVGISGETSPEHVKLFLYFFY